MRQIALVGGGGCAGAILRYGVSLFILRYSRDWRFPLHTVLVNTAGCLAAGILSGLLEKHHFFGTDARLFLFAGLLGGFTTFSAFGLETVSLLQRDELLMAGLNVLASVGFGIIALWIGMRAAA